MEHMPEPHKVCIIGGGVAGLTAAHELKERGFRVTVYERWPIFGGKARSGTVPRKVGVPEDIIDLPSEHGFRFFPGFYRHLIDTMARIPLRNAPGRRVVDSLIEANKGVIAQADKPFCVFPTKGPRGIGTGLRFLRDLLANPSLGLGPGEAAFAALKLATAMTTCDARREAELDDLTWWNYMRASEMSDDYRRVIINGLTQNFVAMDAEKTSMRTAITILARLLQDFISGHGLDRILNGPTSEVWIDPWVDYLRSNASGQFPVCFRPNTLIHALIFDEGKNRISGLQLHNGAVVKDPDCIYLAAVPVEAMIDMLHNSSPVILEYSPTLKLLYDEHLQVNWMSGIMYYLKTDSRMAPGHIVYLDSGWAITSISQNQFWAKHVQSYGGHNVRGILSAIISDWFKPGNGGIPAAEAKNSAEVAKEALAEICRHTAAEHGIDLLPDNIAGHYLDADIIFEHPELLKRVAGLRPAVHFTRMLRTLLEDKLLQETAFFRVKQNLEPLFINTVGSWNYRPDELTDIPNLLLASDYVRTNTDLATMEGANESGRRAVNRILNLLHVPGRRCRIFEFDEPAMFAPMKEFDRYCFELGLPHPGFLTSSAWRTASPSNASFKFESYTPTSGRGRRPKARKPRTNSIARAAEH
jgi:uncharacterized protein with NAD-binding domain and iron-sulfur cluster